MYMIPLTRNQVAIVDDADYALVAPYRWHCMAKGYAARRLRVCEGSAIVLMHRIIMQAPTDLQIDHINGNKLDNRRSNLRLVTNQQNRFNQRPRKDNKTGYKGVCWNRRVGKFCAQIHHNHTNMLIGHYSTAIEAAHAYNRKAAELFGEYAYLNEVIECSI